MKHAIWLPRKPLSFFSVQLRQLPSGELEFGTRGRDMDITGANPLKFCPVDTYPSHYLLSWSTVFSNEQVFLWEMSWWRLKPKNCLQI